MINLQLRLRVSLVSLILFFLLHIQAAVSDSLQPLGDLTSNHPSLIPFAKCTANGRSLFAAKTPQEYPYDSDTPITLLEAFDFPNDIKVIKRFSESSYANSAPSLFLYGCFAAGSAVMIPKSGGILRVDRSNEVQFIPYPTGHFPIEYVFSSNGFVYLVGSDASLIQVDSRGVFRWIFEPLTTFFRSRYFSAPNVLTFLASGKTIELDLTTFKRVEKPQLAIQVATRQPLRYYSGARGKLMAIAPADEIGDYRAAVGDGSIQGSVILENMSFLNASDVEPMRMGGKLYFVANQHEIWTTDGSKSGTSMVYKGSLDNGKLAIVANLHGKLIVAGNGLFALTPGGTVTLLSAADFTEFTKAKTDTSGRLWLWDYGVVARTNGTPAGSMIIEDSNIDRYDNVLILKDRVLLSRDEGTFRVDQGILEAVSCLDTTATKSSSPTNLGQVGNGLFFSIRNGDSFDGYRTEGTPDRTRQAFKIPLGYTPVPIGALDGTLFFATANANLYSYRPDSGRLEVRLFEGKSSGGYVAVDSSGFVSREGLLFATDDEIFKVDSATSTAKLVKTLPSNVQFTFGFSSQDEKLYFMTSSRDANRDSLYTPWLSDGTAAGTKMVTTNIPNRKPHVGILDDVLGVYYSDASGKERLIWKPEAFGYDECSADPKIVEIEGTYFIHARCEGVFVVAQDFSSAAKIDLDQIVWTLKHRGYLYVAHKTYDGRGVISRVRPGQITPELVYTLDESLWLSRNDAESLGDRIVMWLTSEHIGTEPYVLIAGADECLTDPRKATPGVCGCGVEDLDVDLNGIVDCKEPADKCPRDPNKTSPGFCGCGFADSDLDKNGRPDCLENCRMGRFFPGCNSYVTPTPQPD